MTTLVRLLRSRPGFRWLWIGETTSLLGDWLSYVAVSILALHAGGGAFDLGVVFAAHVMPTALVSPIAGIVADRVDKRRLLVGTQVVMAGLMVLMVFAALAKSLWAVQLLLFLRSAVAGFFHPAKTAALQALVEPDELLDANAIDAATWSFTFTLGTALGGVVALAGPIFALVVDTLTFVVAAFALLRVPELPSAAPTREPLRFEEMTVALGVAARRDGLLEAVLTKAPLAIAGGGAWVLLNLAAERFGLLGSTALALGVLQAARGVGTGVGPLLAKRFLRRGATSRTMLRASAIVTLLSIAAFTLVSETSWGWVLVLTAVAWGIGSGGLWVFSATIMQRLSPPSVLGRLSSVDMLALTFAQGAAALAAGYLVDTTASDASAGWFGLIAGGIAYIALRSALPRPRAELAPIS